MVFLVAVHHKNSSRFGSEKQLFEKILIKIETVARLQRTLGGGQLSLPAKSRQKPRLTFESATTASRAVRLANLGLA
jgi:hypothetical protein